MHWVIEETNGSDHKGQLYIIWVTETGRLITWNMTYICSTPVTMEQYLCEQIKKAAGQMEDIFMQAATLEHSRMPRPHKAGTKTHMSHEKEIMNREGERRDSITPINKVRRLAAGIL